MTKYPQPNTLAALKYDKHAREKHIRHGNNTNMMRKDSKVKQKSVPRNYNKQLNFDTKDKNKVKEQLV